MEVIKDESYYKSLDKRTKEYKEYKASFKDKTEIKLGDAIEKVTKATGVKKLVEYVTENAPRVEVNYRGELIWKKGIDCGCDKRKEKLNKKSISLTTVRCFTEQQYNDWTNFRNRERKNEVTHKQQVEIIIPIYAHLFARQLKPMSCCVKPYIEAIDKVYLTYQ